MRKGCLFVLMLAAAGAGAEETSIKFSAPAYPMTNLVANDALDGGALDYMHLGGNGFDLTCASGGVGGMDRYWESGGFFGGYAMQVIYGSLETDPNSDPFKLYGFGTSFPINWFFDLLSEDVDDNSLPIYFGLHSGTMQMVGSMSYDTTIVDHYENINYGPPGFPFYVRTPIYKDITATQHLSMLQVQVGWQLGIQYGLNLGEYLKVIPYVDVSQDVYNFSLISIYTSYSSYGADSPPPGTTISGNLGALPITMTPGFDLILRKLGLSLGGAFQTTKQAGGTMKQLNLHLRWSTKFRSICGM